METLGWPVLAGFILLLSGAGLGRLLFRLQSRAMGTMDRQSQWPIAVRELVTPEEHAVWRWLRSAFADQFVMLKVPVVRYTTPTTRGEGKLLHQRLSGIYCTFTICGADGTVIGCIDVGAPRDADKTHWYLKESLLEKCGIPYVMVRSGRLPDVAEVRAAFIGQIELTDVNPLQAEPTEGFAVTLRDSLELTSVTPLAKPLAAPRGRTVRPARAEPNCRAGHDVGSAPWLRWFDKPSDRSEGGRSTLSSI